MSNFVYFGTPYVARDTLSSLVEAGFVPSVVVTSPDAPKGRGMDLTPCDTKVWAESKNIPVLTPVVLDEEFISALKAFDCEYGIAVAYGKLLPQTVIDIFPKGILNVHYSLLPLYRGASPVETALWNGDSITGVTVQRMVLAMDAGDVLAQEEVSILQTDTTLTLRPRLIEAGANLLISTLPRFIEGTIEAKEQEHARATRAPKIRKDQGELILSNDPQYNWNTYRALRESPGTYFFGEKEGARIRIKITGASYEDGVFTIHKIVPEGKLEQDFSWLAQNGWKPIL